MTSSRPTPSWTGDPSIMPNEQITIVDIMSINTNQQPGDTTNSITYSLGSAFTGEIYTTDAIQVGTPGIISIPLGPGEVDSTTANITPSNTSTTGAQAIAYKRNDQWIVLGTRDTRTQDRPGNAGAGDTVMYAQQGRASVVCKSDGSVVMSTTTTGDATGDNMMLSLTPQGLYFNAPFGKIAFDAAGFRISTSSGASISAIGTADPTSGNAIFISAGSTTISSGIITLGNPINTAIPLPAVYGIVPAPVPGVPILGTGVGAVVVAAAASTTVFIGL